ncbi:MAG TPA: hypothetical protein VFJ05_06970 [Nitrososphaeraceae archaeon]|nr:hypothetical protein [Nitrososphaeraceae archaeon]
MSTQVHHSIYKAGRKEGVAFTSLQQLQRYEPEIFKLFKEIKDGEKAETSEFIYRIRDAGRFGLSITRFSKAQQTAPQQQPQQSVINTGANIRSELMKNNTMADSERDSDARILASLVEIKKLVNTILISIDMVAQRIESTRGGVQKI